MKRLLLAAVAVVLLGSAALVPEAQARCWWNGYGWHCWYPQAEWWRPHPWWRHHHPYAWRHWRHHPYAWRD
jgi:hypothetical protein